MFERLAADVSSFGTPLTADAITEAVEDPANDPLKPIPVASDVNELLEVYLLERHREFPGVDVDRTAVRSYPYGSVAAHVLGYVGSINDEELDAVADEEEKPYLAGDEIGKTGVEATYEEQLRGIPGQRVYELDAEGNIVRLIEERSHDPVPGNDLVLTIDVDLQAYAEQRLAEVAEEGEGDVEQARASVVIEDPQDGSILTMASYPAYQPEEFVNGLSSQRYAELNLPTNGYPLNNWAIQGQYAPASTFKLITGMAALEAGFRTPQDAVQDPGFYIAQGCSAEDESCRFKNDNETPYGTVNITRALSVSSDVYFYGIGDWFWLRRDELGDDAMQQQIEQWGFGEPTGIALPSEIPGLVSTPALKAQRHEELPEAFPYGDWRSGDNINMAIGQGDMLVTPLQLTNAYATFANGGTLREPFLVRQILEEQNDGPADNPTYFEVLEETKEGETIDQIEITDERFQAVEAGLVGVTRGEGTAATAFEAFNPNFTVAGKTGTAQVESQDAGNALFVSYGPVGQLGARYAITAIFEETLLYGGEVAAPYVRSIYDVIADPSLLPKAQTAESVLVGEGDIDEQLPDELAAGPGAGG
jgi:penicillin-binding protein 2